MPTLVLPTTRVQGSFLEAVAEFHAEGRHLELDPLRLADPEVFRRYVRDVRAVALPETPRLLGRVPETFLWWVEGSTYLGRLSIRHELTEELRWEGGHIGYEVRPRARRRGHATRMLEAALPIAYRLGIDPVLVTCDTTNIASRRVIEHNGGRLESEVEGKLLFWLPTGPDGEWLGVPPGGVPGRRRAP